MYFDDSYKLCYVSNRTAFFTCLPLEEQWGDDWDDAPYDCNAGEPYEDVENQIKKIMYYSNSLETPGEISYNCSFSVKDINSGASAWLRERWVKEPVTIPAGCTMNEFCSLVKKSGGTVFIDPDEYDLGNIIVMDETIMNSIPYIYAYDQNGKIVGRTKHPAVVFDFFDKVKKNGVKGYKLVVGKEGTSYDIDKLINLSEINSVLEGYFL